MGKVRKFSNNKYGHAMHHALRLGSQAVNMYKMYKSHTGQQKQSNYHQQSLTGQHDVRRVYKRKRMPYRKKKRWVRFSKKVNAVITKALAPKFVVLNDATTGTAAVNTQYTASLNLYGVEGSATFGPNDMARIAAADSEWSDATRIRFESAVFDMTLTNVNTIAVELDVYEFIYRKDDTSANTVTLIDRLLVDSPNIGVGLTRATVGWTPFDTPGIGKWIRIMKKTKYFVQAGGQMTYQIRDARNRYFNTSEFDQGTFLAKKFFTRGLLLIAKGIPTATDGAGTVDLSFGVTRSYHYTLLKSAQSADGVA